MPPSHSHVQEATTVPTGDSATEELLDIKNILSLVRCGLSQTIGLGLLGFVIVSIGYLVARPWQVVATSTRLVFSFPGYEHGEYPDHSKFQPGDVLAPTIILEALKRQNIEAAETLQSKIRGAINIEGIIPPEVIKERDRQRAAGQTPSIYIPDEYVITLTLPRNILPNDRRELLLNDIVNVYRENFQRTYADAPITFGNAFESLKHSDYSEYDLTLNYEALNLIAFLRQQQEQGTNGIKSFRSRTTNLSYSDLEKQAQLFIELQLNETLGLIYANGLTKDRKTALLKMDYYLRTLENQEHHAIEDEKVVRDLLDKGQERSRDYVLGIKSQASQPTSNVPVLDRGLIDSLLANDSYGFLVRRALDAGLEVKRIQSRKEQLLQRRKNMESFAESVSGDQTIFLAKVENSLRQLEDAYNELVDKIRKTHADFTRQQFGNSIRISGAVQTEGIFRRLVVNGVIGVVLGVAAGIGLSLLGFYINPLRSK